MKLIQCAALVYVFVIGFQLYAEGFIADTPVHNFGNRPATIKQLCEGIAKGKKRFVSGWHEDRKQWSSRRVRRVGCGTVNCTITLAFDDNPAHDITCSPIQFFYIPQRSEWVEAYALRIGDLLHTESGETIRLAGLSLQKQEREVYALRVRKNHTFCVGYYRILTHNKHFSLLPLAIMARIGVAFGTGAVAGSTAGGFFGPLTCAGGFTVGGVVCALATCATIGHELYHYRMQVGTYEIERTLLSRNDVGSLHIHPCQTVEAPSKGTIFVNVPLPPHDIREQKSCGNTQLPDLLHSGDCRMPIDNSHDRPHTGCGGKPAELEDLGKGVGCFPSPLASIFAQESGQAATPVKTVEDLLKDCKPGKKTKGKSRQFQKDGGFEQAEEDFKILTPTDVRPIPTGKAGTLPDGRTVNIRTESSYETPTLEVLNHKTGRKIKIRYMGQK